MSFAFNSLPPDLQNAVYRALTPPNPISQIRGWLRAKGYECLDYSIGRGDGYLVMAKENAVLLCFQFVNFSILQWAMLYVRPGKRGQGLLEQAMKDVLSYADSEKITLTGIASTFEVGEADIENVFSKQWWSNSSEFENEQIGDDAKNERWMNHLINFYGFSQVNPHDDKQRDSYWYIERKPCRR